MRRILAAVLVSITLSIFGVAKDKPGNTDQAVLSIEKEMLNALLKGDASANERYLADTYTFTSPDGEVSNKAQSVADLKSGDLKFESATLDDPKVSVYGDTAIVTFNSTDKGTYKGKDISGKTRWTDVFVKRNGKWQIVASHGSRIGN
jgi:ketosteroid isomerase-like protein